MKVLKKKMSLILAIMMLAMSVLPLNFAFASTSSKNVSMSVQLAGKELVYGSTYEVKAGDKISVNASSKNADIAFVAYYFYDKGASDAVQTTNYNNRTKIYKSAFDIVVPNGTAGSTKVLWVEAVDKSDDSTPNVVTKTGWQLYYLKYANNNVIDTTVGEVNVAYNSKTLANASTTEVEAGKTVRLSSTKTDILKKIYFKWDGGELREVTTSPYDLVIPSTFTAGSKHTLDVIALYDNGKYSERKAYNLTIATPDTKVNGDVNVAYAGKTLANGATVDVKAGNTVQLSATPANRVTKIYFKWDQGQLMEVTTFPYNLIIPSTFKAGETHRLDVMAKYDNGELSAQKTYYLRIPAENTLTKDVNVAYSGKTLANGSTTNVKAGNTVQLSATPVDRLTKIYFKWDEGQLMEVTVFPYNLIIPTSFEEGTTHRLDVMAKYDNGELSAQKTYYLRIPVDSSKNPIDDGLDILPWEKENNEIDTLSISLRNDSESNKANKNFYALDEEVTYYIDFKNGGKAIKDEVTITLELPLAFKVVDADKGTVNTAKRTITWTYPQGMEKDYEGTKTVVIKYTSFDKKNTDYKIVYPVAKIAKAGKVVDNSAVINLIYVDSDTKLDLAHEPYMYGDEFATTFRPDDTITRAEGALVLTRILLGQSAIDNVRVASVYPDLDQTYLEAQKAIIAATKYGIINGYTDGYYRPNQTMTRAEFMKIIAKFIELNAEDEGIDGLEVKDITNLVKLYKDPVVRYAVNGTTVSTHWAIEEVTLLTRLNMTDASKNRNLRLDEGISRAEVAQLVNFYTFRAPAEVTSRTTTQFSDVNRRHSLFADIVEATRPAHDAIITEDGTEIAK